MMRISCSVTKAKQIKNSLNCMLKARKVFHEKMFHTIIEGRCQKALR
jgi:hypothetical protein